FEALRRTLYELLLAVRDAQVTHRWGGPIGIPRDWCASVGLDRSTGIGWAGGYVGGGGSTTKLGGPAVGGRVTAAAGESTRPPWVGHRSPEWEPEPLRWLGLNAGLQVMSLADWEEARSGRPSRAAAFMGRFLGG